MAHDAGVGDKAIDVAGAETRHALEVEAGEGGAEVLALPQDRQPRQAGLKALQAYLFEQAAVVGHRPAPLVVVIGGVLGRAVSPEAAPLAVGTDNKPFALRHVPASRADPENDAHANRSLATLANPSLAIDANGYQRFTIRLESAALPSPSRKRSNDNSSKASTRPGFLPLRGEPRLLTLCSESMSMNRVFLAAALAGLPLIVAGPVVAGPIATPGAGDHRRRPHQPVGDPAQARPSHRPRRRNAEARRARRGADPLRAPHRPGFPATDGRTTRPHEPAGTIIIDTEARYLYLILDGGKAKRYGVGVGRPGFEWAGVHEVTRKAEWPDWTPPPQMHARQAGLPDHMAGGVDNPLGARALYLGSTLYRIHGSNQPWTIGQAVSSGCIRMRNEDVIDLYDRVGVGTRVIVI